MPQVIADISVSLDGFVAGPDDSSDRHALGIGGERLHQWLFELDTWRARAGREGGDRGVGADIMGEYFTRTGAAVIGRRMFDHGEKAWGDEPPFRVTVFVVTHRPLPPRPMSGGTHFEFVTGGVAEAVGRAVAAAGAQGKNVAVMGGGQVIAAALAAGVLDELRLHVVPVLLGGGRPLFAEPMDPAIALETTRVELSSGVTHVFHRVLK
ncbi:dihydrofolate reductase family protein (plasmid) [Streptomyces sp. NBC_00846]|uniref:dihydrofolate reductase family protein n=1 Tax=Streptomyces sp. NBC_00846 TaxID=2975849 RepID=UPI002F9176C8|nr:dihydrofolate reductase family protein [Streptomyces sp. NBC_00846]